MDNQKQKAIISESARVPFPTPLIPVKIKGRKNRFVVEVVTEGGQPLQLHLPNSGRMRELLTDGAGGLAHLHNSPSRRTAGTLLLVRYNDRWVSVDARMPNRLFRAAIQNRALAPFQEFSSFRSEVTIDGARLDFLLSGADGTDCFVETKSCNLVENGIALFPDAPTVRGTKHLEILSSLVQDGKRAAVVWFIQRDDARCLRPHRQADPDFAAALDAALKAGVEAYAYRCRVTPRFITSLEGIPVVL